MLLARALIFKPLVINKLKNFKRRASKFSYHQPKLLSALYEIYPLIFFQFKGTWGGRIARFAGVPALPLIPFKHAYVVSEGIPEIRNAPNLRDHDANLYIKIQGETCQIGGYESNPLILDQVSNPIYVNCK